MADLSDFQESGDDSGVSEELASLGGLGGVASDSVADLLYQGFRENPDYDPEAPGYRVFTDNSDPNNPKQVVINPAGEYYLNGEKIWSPTSTDSGSWGSLLNKLGNWATTPKGIAALAATAYSLTGGNQPITRGWKGSIPALTAVREKVPMPAYKPYSGQAAMGGQFFTDTQYLPTSKPEEIAAARAAAKTAATGIAAVNPTAPARATAPITSVPQPVQPVRDMSGLLDIYKSTPDTAADQKTVTLAKGRYLAGPTDGMADKIPSSIDGTQPAKLSHGEFVVPADVVSHLGNGNSDAGADVLYKMMDKVRKARTGTTKQGKKINPDKFTPGGIAGYASGGPVAFEVGGVASSGLSGAATTPLGATSETNLAPWVGDYVGNMLGKAQGLAGEGYQAYTGPLTAGTSPLQTQAFGAAANINPQATFDVTAAQQYMNPFVQMALKPQLDEMRRQSDISRMEAAGRLSKAGAYGGSRQAIMESEILRNLGQQQALTTGKAYETAFDKAMGQYNKSREQQLADIGALSGIGAQERAIEQQNIDALRGEFEKQRQFPYEQLKFQQSMLTGLPVGSTTVTPNTSGIGNLMLTTEQVAKLSDFLNKNVFQ